jgi:organic radical activating enzyme
MKYVEFYMTNVCNLNCQGCNSISNFNIAGGTHKWKDYQDIYKKWSNKLDIDNISFMGGEPTLNPDLINWIVGVRKLWPTARLFLSTNGLTLKKKQQELYNICCLHNVNLIVTLHNRHTADAIINDVTKWLVEPLTIGELALGIMTILPDNKIELDPEAPKRLQKVLDDCIASYNIIKDPSWPACTTLEEWYQLDASIRQECEQQHNFTFEVALPGIETGEFTITDTNNMIVNIRKQFYLNQGIINANVDNNQFEFNHSNPDKAFSVCSQSACPQFYQGKLHKCAPSHVFKDIIEQFDTDLLPIDLDLIRNYVPVDINSSDSDVLNFIEGLNHAIPQCKFCPDQLTVAETLSSTTKKIQLMRRLQ